MKNYEKQTPHISKQSVLQLNHTLLLVLLSLHPLKLNLMFVLLRQFLHRFIQFSLLIALSARLRLSSTSLTHIVEACKHDKNQHDPQEDVVVKQPGNVLQVLDLHAEDPCASRIPRCALHAQGYQSLRTEQHNLRTLSSRTAEAAGPS